MYGNGGGGAAVGIAAILARLNLLAVHDVEEQSKVSSDGLLFYYGLRLIFLTRTPAENVESGAHRML